MEVGSLAEWANAGGTILAFAGASFAALIAVKSYRVQRRLTNAQLELYAEQNRERELSQRRSQATKIAAWPLKGRHEWYAFVLNDSGLPVYRMAIRVRSERFDFTICRGTQGPTPAYLSKKLTNALRVMLEKNDALNMNPETLHVEVCFTDAAGLRWHRAADGRLTEVENDFEFPVAGIYDREIPMKVEPS